MVFTANNSIRASVGDLVRVESATGPVMKAATVLYVLPLVLFFLGYLAGQLLWGIGAAAACAAFALGIAVAVLYDRRVAKKKKTVYTITGFAGAGSGEF
jgi:sigma-E factor negative regulatory protein RseC